MAQLLGLLSTPGDSADLSQPGVLAWTRTVSGMLDRSRAGDPQSFEFDAPRPQFFNPLKTPIGDDAQEKGIFWFAFPRTLMVTTTSDAQRWDAADKSRDRQDEYCEWAVHKERGKIVRVVFTTETPDYWQVLAAQNRPRVLQLYRDFLGRTVGKDEIYDAQNRYVPGNDLNLQVDSGPIHLVQGTNFLSAAVELAAAATIVRRVGGRTLTAEQELIGCSRYGEPTRNSDPHIGAQVNELARMRADVTLADPPGLFIAGLSTAGWSTPDGTDPQTFWRPLRGRRGRRVRAAFEVPPDRGYTVSEVKIRGRPIQFGAQIADFVSIKLIGLACRFGQSTTPPLSQCRRPRT